MWNDSTALGEKQGANLWQLAHGLCFLPLPVAFDMRYFCTMKDEFKGDFAADDAVENVAECGTAARIEWVLQHGGAPENHWYMMLGKIPLCYRITPKEV